MNHRYITYPTYLATIILAIYIMSSQWGLVDNLDFGAGAYYYADIPSFDRFTAGSTTYGLMLWLCIALFLIWGWMMFRLWKWVDKQ